MHVCPSANMPPRPLRSSAHTEGLGREHPFGPLLRCAALGTKRAGASRRDRAAERSKGPRGCSAVRLSNPLLATPASGRLRGEHARKCAHASLTDSPQLFERSAPARSEFCGAPRNRPDAGRPAAKRRGRRLGVAFSLVTFFWRRKRKLLARRATPGLRPQQKHAPRSAQRSDKLSPNQPQGHLQLHDALAIPTTPRDTPSTKPAAPPTTPAAASHTR